LYPAGYILQLSFHTIFVHKTLLKYTIGLSSFLARMHFRFLMQVASRPIRFCPVGTAGTEVEMWA